MKWKLLLSSMLLFTIPSFASAQCSCGGTPLLGSLELPATLQGNWQFALTYDFNNIADFYSGTDELSSTLNRKTHAGLFEVSYGLTSRLSLSTLVSIVQQNRHSAISVRTRGLGDVAMLAKYSIIPLNTQTQRSLALGIGPKFPVGDSKVKNSEGILLPESLQPGTGSWDLLLWGYFYQGFQPVTAASFFTTTSYKISSKNWRDFRYGDELSITLGTSYGTSTPFDYSLLLQFRTIEEYELNGALQPNTGGLWLDVVPGIHFKLSNSLGLRASGAIPVYRDLKGSQLTTSYTASVTLFYAITKQPKLQVF